MENQDLNAFTPASQETKPSDPTIMPFAPKHWEDFKYFKPNEFDSPDAPGTGFLMNVEFIRTLEKIRKECNFPFYINSGYRTQKRNSELGKAVTDSAHTHGLACDIAIMTTNQVYLIVASAIKNGIKRIGIARTFVHLDMDMTKPEEVLWLYSNGGQNQKT